MRSVDSKLPATSSCTKLRHFFHGNFHTFFFLKKREAPNNQVEGFEKVLKTKTVNRCKRNYVGDHKTDNPIKKKKDDNPHVEALTRNHMEGIVNRGLSS